MNIHSQTYQLETIAQSTYGLSPGYIARDGYHVDWAMYGAPRTRDKCNSIEYDIEVCPWSAR